MLIIEFDGEIGVTPQVMNEANIPEDSSFAQTVFDLPCDDEPVFIIVHRPLDIAGGKAHIA